MSSIGWKSCASAGTPAAGVASDQGLPVSAAFSQRGALGRRRHAAEGDAGVLDLGRRADAQR